MIHETGSDFDLLFVTDLNYTEEQLRLLGTLKRPGNKIVYLDHHNYTYDLASVCDELGIIHRQTKDRCGCMITYEFLKQKNIGHLQQLNIVTDIYDRWQKQEPEFFEQAIPLNDLFWEYSMYKFIDKFKDGYKLDSEDKKVITRKAEERKTFINTTLKNHSMIDEDLKILITMNANTNFLNDFTLYMPGYNVYVLLANSENNSFQFSIRISDLCDLTIQEFYSTIQNKVDWKLQCGGHEKSGGVTIPQDKLEVFMDAIYSTLSERGTDG